MGKGSGTTRAAMPQTGARGGVPSASGRLIDKMQSGTFRRMSRQSKTRLLDEVRAEGVSIKGAAYTAEEERVLTSYTSQNFQRINGELRGGNMSVKTRQEVKTLDAIMAKNTLDRDIIVYRGSDAERGADKAYTSTSTPAYNAYTFAGGSIHAYRIPKGTHCAVVGGAENEVILPRDFDLAKHKIK